jgi:hypothetical protein
MRTDTRTRQFDPRNAAQHDQAFVHGIVRTDEVSLFTNPIPAGATLTLSNLVPANVFLLGVVLHVVEEIFGSTASLTSFNVGDGSDVDLYGATISPAFGTRTSSLDFTAAAAGFRYTLAAEDVVLTAVGENFAGGAVAVSVLVLSVRGDRKRGA